ncbi:MAG TPA: prolyl oligopeptidase family serine peptidase, partial [Anaerolineales bacterium]|nr:prolyl oligopeptidase family serine peptidase [Anaerolineales bacterium]
LILFHGADDAVVPPEHSSGLAASLKRRGVPHEHHLFDGEGHGWRKDETVVAYYAAIERFLREHL